MPSFSAQLRVCGSADDHHFARPGALCHLRCEKADRAGAQHYHEVLRLDLRALANIVDGVRGRLHEGARIETDCVRQPVQQLALGDEVLRESAVYPPPRGTLLCADLNMPPPTEPTMAAGAGMRLAHDALADLPALNTLAKLDDRT